MLNPAVKRIREFCRRLEGSDLTSDAVFKLAFRLSKHLGQTPDQTKAMLLTDAVAALAHKSVDVIPSVQQLLSHVLAWEKSKVLNEPPPFLSSVHVERLEVTGTRELHDSGREDCVKYFKAACSSIINFNLYGERGPYQEGHSNYNARENAITSTMQLSRELERIDRTKSLQSLVDKEKTKNASGITASQKPLDAADPLNRKGKTPKVRRNEIIHTCLTEQQFREDQVYQHMLDSYPDLMKYGKGKGKGKKQQEIGEPSMWSMYRRWCRENQKAT